MAEVSDGVQYRNHINNLKSRSVFTPDLKDLEMYEKHLVFIWDNCKHGFFNHRNVLMNMDCIGKAVSAEGCFTMKRSNSYPFLSDNPRSPKQFQNRIRGEIYAISAQTMIRLDALMQNNVDYVRERKYFFCSQQVNPIKNATSGPCVLAWIYLTTPSFWDTLKTMGYGTTHLENNKWAYEWLERTHKHDG